MTRLRVWVWLPHLARALRIEYPGAIYQVMARGNQGRKIYADDGDRKRWLSTLGQAWQRTSVARRWLAENLRMGYETRVSQAVREIESSQEPAVMAMKKRLAKSVL